MSLRLTNTGTIQLCLSATRYLPRIIIGQFLTIVRKYEPFYDNIRNHICQHQYLNISIHNVGETTDITETYVCMRACVRACLRACVHACLLVCVRACMRVCVLGFRCPLFDCQPTWLFQLVTVFCLAHSRQFHVQLAMQRHDTAELNTPFELYWLCLCWT